MSAFSVRGRLALGADLVPGAVVVEDGRILEIVRDLEDTPLPDPVLEAAIVAPGLIDLQVNGGFGVEVGDDSEAIRRLAARLPETGVTSFLPTVVSSSPDFYRRVYEAFDTLQDDRAGARILGLHLEGPYLSPERYGAHRRELIETADAAFFGSLLQTDALRLMTLAPERPGAMDRIRWLRKRGVVVSLGHTNASYDEFVKGVDAGATMVTHLFNAMPPFQHRAPGAMGAALVDDRVTAGLIPDGIHSHPASLRLAIKTKGPDRIVLVTDMMSAAGMPAGSYELGGQRVIVDERSARIESGSLAGSILTLDQAIRNVVRWTDLSPVQAIRMATEVPARLLGLERIGRIVVGADADLVLLDQQLCLHSTIIRGDVVVERDA